MKHSAIFFVATLLTSLSSTYSEMRGNGTDDCYSGTGSGALGSGTYLGTCPEVETIVFYWVQSAVSQDPRMAASLVRLHFHDCFVNGCDASLLLDDIGSFVGEKTAGPNLNSLRGFEVIDSIKSEIEAACPATVSCADILAIAARDSVVLSGGPSWDVQTGRRDVLTASKATAASNIPAPNSDVQTLLSKFQNVGLSLRDLVALSGAHTMGKARCSTFSSRLAGGGSASTNIDFLASLRQLCSGPNSNTTLAHLDLVTPATFDNQYYVNLISGEGLLPSDQALAADTRTRGIVENYANNVAAFFEDFKDSMLKMGNLGILTGTQGEIRANCRITNA